MGKQKIEKIVFQKNTANRVKWSDIKNFNLNDGDIIDIDYIEESDYAYYHVAIIRMVEETDEEYKVRLEIEEIQNQNLKKHRRENYLKLKKEFENE